MNLEKLCCGQYLYNLIVRDVEREILPACSDQGMGFICWSPLGAGMLAGKYKKADSPDEGTRLAFTAVHSLPLYWHERGFRIAEELVKVADNLEKPPALVALAWILGDRRVTSVIVGARKADQLRENLLAGEWDLPSEPWIKLDKVVEFEHGYPKLWMDATFPKTFGEEEF
jgi:aryl-alcohol dehydrogenase-like predicted oxidoreductase